jgi:hypothetical protein
MVVGLVESTSGSLTLFGDRLDNDPEGCKRRIGYVPEEPHLYTYLTAPEYLRLVGNLRELPRPQLDEKIVNLLRLFGLWENRYLAMSGFSKGMRAAMLLPGNLRAGWIFRLTEAATTRPHQLNAVRHTLMAVGVVAPAVIAFPVQAAVLGVPSAVAAFPVVVLLGGLVVEAVTINWRRIPFTCTVLFGKRPAALLMLFAYAGFSVLVTIGAILERAAVSGPRAWLTVVSILLLIGAGLRWLRLRTWGQLPLEFEDYLLDTIQPLGIR